MRKIAFGVVIGIILSFVVFYGGTKIVAQQNRFQFQGAYWNTDFGIVSGGHLYRVLAVCDSANGTMVYTMANSFRYGGISTVANSCAKKQ